NRKCSLVRAVVVYHHWRQFQFVCLSVC
ncbi:hypothetical protein D049_0583B, partial [Vibrio parahaemolyticus VPTS-2010]